MSNCCVWSIISLSHSNRLTMLWAAVKLPTQHSASLENSLTKGQYLTKLQVIMKIKDPSAEGPFRHTELACAANIPSTDEHVCAPPQIIFEFCKSYLYTLEPGYP